MAVSAVGAAASDPLMHAFEYVTGGSVRIIIRFTTRSFQKYDAIAGLWIDIPGCTLTGSVYDFFSVTSFAGILSDKVTYREVLLFSNGVDGLCQFDPTDGSASQITGEDVPSARHLTTFNGRIIATNVTDESGHKPTRLRWSEKDDFTRWKDDDLTFIGAGFEDVTASPGTVLDICQATIPITDEVALLFRSRSTWLVSVTGFVDAPFRFSLLFDELGTESPYSLAKIPGGVIGFFRENFYTVTQSAPSPIGTDIMEYLAPKITDPRQLFGSYDPFRQEYSVVVPDDGAIWRHSLREKGWTRDVYPFTPKTVAPTHYDRTDLVIDDLVGVNPWEPRGIKIHGRTRITRAEGYLGSGEYIEITPDRYWSWGIEAPAFDQGKPVLKRVG